MANEASVVELYGDNSAGEVFPITVAAGTAITKGALIALTASPRTGAAHTSASQVFVGIASADKDSADASTQLGLYTDGVFNVGASGSINDGDIVILSGTANFVQAYNTFAPFPQVVGVALNDAASNRVVVRINK